MWRGARPRSHRLKWAATKNKRYPGGFIKPRPIVKHVRVDKLDRVGDWHAPLEEIVEVLAAANDASESLDGAEDEGDVKQWQSAARRLARRTDKAAKLTHALTKQLWKATDAAEAKISCPSKALLDEREERRRIEQADREEQRAAIQQARQERLEVLAAARNEELRQIEEVAAWLNHYENLYNRPATHADLFESLCLSNPEMPEAAIGIYAEDLVFPS